MIQYNKVFNFIQRGIMESIRLKAYGKINLTLDVLGKYDDGFHKLETIMHAVELCDDVLIRWYEEKRDNIEINLKTNKYYLPVDERNIAYKAARVMVDKFYHDRGGRLFIDIGKKIPVAAGMAGGSSNCAAVMLGLNHIWKLNLSLMELCQMSEALGSDVAFSMAAIAKGNRSLSKTIRNDDMACFCAVGRDKGGRLEKLPPLKTSVLLSKPPISVSTAEVYKGFVFDEVKMRPDNAKMIEALHRGDVDEKIGLYMANALESYTLKKYESVEYTKSVMKEKCPNAVVLMSGSGPTVFGLAPNEKDLLSGFDTLKQKNRETYITRTMV